MVCLHDEVLHRSLKDISKGNLDCLVWLPPASWLVIKAPEGAVWSLATPSSRWVGLHCQQAASSGLSRLEASR